MHHPKNFKKYFEFIKYIFGRIGKRKDIRDVQKRNRNDFASKPIPKDNDEDLEIFTYVYFIFEKEEEKISIIYLTSLAAPGVLKLKCLHEGINGGIDILPIITNNVVIIYVN